MKPLLNGWNTEKVVLLSSDNNTAKSSRKLAYPTEWMLLEHDGYTLWGECREAQGKNDSIFTIVDLLRLDKGEQASSCTCTLRKQPCKHALGLLLIAVEHPDDMLYRSERDERVNEWLGESRLRLRDRLTRRLANGTSVPDPEQRERTFESRKANVAAGMDELALWLKNLIRQGLADPQINTYAFWDNKADRMLDAQAPGVANWLREMGGLPSTGEDWVETMLDRLGRLQLLVESFRRFDELPHEVQCDLRTVIGWRVQPYEVDTNATVRDRWLVLGAQHEKIDENFQAQRIWLRGQDEGRNALIYETAYGDEPFDTYLPPGRVIDAALAYYPSRYPLRALIVEREDVEENDYSVRGASILENIETYAGAISKNPWIAQFPFWLDAVIPTRFSDDWVVREVDGTFLPLSKRFEHRWSLLALSGGHPIRLAGEWDGQALLPVGAVVESRYVDFNLVRELS